MTPNENTISTRLLTRLSQNQISTIENELDNSGLQWGPHYLLKQIDDAPLRHGSSIYLRSIHIETHEFIVDHSSKFVKTIEVLSNTIGVKSDTLARSYWHKLEPGERIDIHRDLDSSNTAYFQSVRRHLLFLNTDPGFVAILNQQLWNFCDERQLSGSLIQFDPSDWHFFFNSSEKTVKFLVIDFYRN